MDNTMYKEYERQAKHLTDMVKKAIDNLENFSFQDQMRFILAYMEFAETADDILAKYDGRNERISKIINDLNNLDILEDDDE